MNQKKKKLGQYFTEECSWLLPQVIDFIEQSNCSKVYDPFAGEGHLVEAVKKTCRNITVGIGCDIDDSLSWTINDSLVSIPSAGQEAIIITNPPYISNYSAARKHILSDLQKYFDSTEYDDVYLLALDNCLQAQEKVVAIIPETFINSPYKKKNKLSLITVLEDNPFNDTDCPVIVACFDGIDKPFCEIDVYKNEKFIDNLEKIESTRLLPRKNIPMRFNDPQGWLGVRCIDGVNPGDRLHFDFKENIDYDWNKGIKVSSRLFTLISIDIEDAKKEAFIKSCNGILEKLRADSNDIVLSPFKGNNKNGLRRRRLDYATCRAIIEQSFYIVKGGI